MLCICKPDGFSLMQLGALKMSGLESAVGLVTQLLETHSSALKRFSLLIWKTEKMGLLIAGVIVKKTGENV